MVRIAILTFAASVLICGTLSAITLKSAWTNFYPQTAIIDGKPMTIWCAVRFGCFRTYPRPQN
jgi:hypothetical protein